MNNREYLLICLMEECAEVQHMASKCLRFGLDEVHITDLSQPPNLERLKAEIVDLIGVLALLDENGILEISANEYTTGAAKKKEKVERYMRHSRSLGILE